MNNTKTVIKYILTFILLILIYFSLLYLTSLIPSNMLEENVKKSSEILKDIGEVQICNLGYKNEKLFLFTDALMLNTAYSIDNKNPIESMLLNRKSYIPGKTTKVHEEGLDVKSPSMYTDSYGNTFQTSELYGLMHEDGNTDAFEYPRYWHGYLVLLRPLLIMFEYSSLRMLSVVVLFLLIITLLYLIWKKVNLASSVIILGGLASVGIWVIGFSLNEITTFYISIIVSIIILLLDRKIEKHAGLVLFITGSVTSFFDLLTTPLITLGIPMIIYFLLLKKEDNDFKKQLMLFVRFCFLWGLGYGLTWGTKWILTDLILGRNIIADAITQITFRTSDNRAGFIVLMKNTLMKVINWIGLKTILLNIVVAIMAGIISIIKFKKNQTRNLDIFIYIFIAILPFLWFFVIYQHSDFHVFFTYRIYILTIICLQIIFAKLTGYYKISK